jgi:thiosulfate/3-mercaptopyruvate sulfurtransferase
MRTPLISPAELSELPDAIILDTRASRPEYEKGHLRNAIYANLESDLSTATEPGHDPAKGGRHPLPSLEEWRRRVGSWSITPATDVVVYDDQSGANAAARAWWMLRALGHERVAVLDGGYQAALAAGLEPATEVRRVTEEPPYPASTWQRPTVSREQVESLREDREWVVLDVRSAERFRGETEPIDPIAGHIPGAVNLFFGDNLRDGVFKHPEMLRAQYKHLLGGRSPEHLIVHCGSGVTACHTLLALEAAGLEGASLYVGSWGEWCRNDLPREP